jgi:ABC-type polysaccharide/polyol phosphate export permease
MSLSSTSPSPATHDPTTGGPDAVELVPPRPSSAHHGVWLTVSEVWRHRELLGILTWREIRMRYKSSALGLVWSMLNPLILMLVYWFLFTVAFPNGVIPRFPVFMLLGLIAWIFFANALSISAVSLIANAAIVTRVAFPRQLVPLAQVGNAFVNFLIGCLLVVPFLIYTGSAPGVETIQAVPVVILFTLFVTGLSLAVAAGTAFFRDIEHLLGVILFPLFFATPILWDFAALGITGDRAKALFFGNPVTPYISGFRTAFYDPQWLSATMWIYMLVGAAVAMALGLWIFSRVYDELPTEL